MFSDTVLDHFHNPRNVTPLEAPTHEGVAGVPGDGPYMLFWFEVADGKIVKSAFRTFGCPAAVACGSITTQLVTGRPVKQALLLTAEDITRLLGGLPEGKGHCPQLAVDALANAFRGDNTEWMESY